jgi:uncharacterized membrane protein YczE
MRTAIIVFGVVLIGLGAFVLVHGGSLTTRRDVLKVGEVQVTTQEAHPVPRWVGVAVLVTGAVVVAAGVRKSG